ncbi:uncharacterized protein MELLADRAFT_111003 [Melampsora larici-populina 98AG31]|uniref:Uncharacterized protein n=1 Tax=Melampsora larici-populina (strain 98AG31 / pathotype 3-4-7) TaxID=747676 RepID=F4S1Q7_MELLP|nr:uncharacterized protein MELLADRAFT_111003 [Melampsora larici-populina 98AG31]EGG01416.1 hypothetical protein MELLADRAFT_111003 [Melampsora larici-populina 98AG31]
MGKGKSIYCPLGQKKKKRRVESPRGSAIVVARVETSQAQYVKNRLEELEVALQQAGAGSNNPTGQGRDDAIADLSHGNNRGSDELPQIHTDEDDDNDNHDYETHADAAVVPNI